jgi:hypothetical protein
MSKNPILKPKYIISILLIITILIGALLQSQNIMMLAGGALTAFLGIILYKLITEPLFSLL